ncbi:MAG TPA: hypothetical protein VFM17_03715 [Candidatus Eisenbacteria bacterium]|nr:hypothetical protein [Candidatus Eisenbacteria bacterium]
MRRARKVWGGRAPAALCAAALAVAGAALFASSPNTPAVRWARAAGEPPLRAPERLSETGLYLPDGSVDSRNRPFAPQYPLWTDGAAKSRWVRLPEGSTIDVTDIDVWRFPAGTTLWKEFAWGGRKVETRMIRRAADGTWIFATYVWTEDQTDAVLAPVEGVPAAFEIGPGKRHSIPAIADCNVCHGSAPAVVLGFNALQLSDDRDPLAPNAEALRPGSVTLKTLVAEGRLLPPRPELVARPPRIRERDPVARAAIGYLSANCGGCHNASGPLSRLGFSLLHGEGGRPEAPEPALATAVGARSRFAVPGVAPDSSRVLAPGAPERSALLYRMTSRRPSSQMPPLGSVITDEKAVALVQRWIEEMRRDGPVDPSNPRSSEPLSSAPHRVVP